VYSVFAESPVSEYLIAVVLAIARPFRKML